MTEEQDNQVQQEINKAINFLGQNKFLEAENTCLKIIDSGDNADAYHILSSIKIYQQEFEDSIKYVKKLQKHVGLGTQIKNAFSVVSSCSHMFCWEEGERWKFLRYLPQSQRMEREYAIVASSD